MHPIQDRIAERLKGLRTEETFLVAVIERARSGASAVPEVLHLHCRELARVRRSIEELLPEALAARGTCAQRLRELRPQVAAIRNLLEQLRVQARSKAMAPESAAARARALQAQLEQTLFAIAARERELETLDEHLPGARRAACSVPPTVAAPSAAQPPVIARQVVARSARASSSALVLREPSGDLAMLDASGDFKMEDPSEDRSLPGPPPGGDPALDAFELAPDPFTLEDASEVAGENGLLPALGEAIEAAYRESFPDPLLDRSRATYRPASRERRASDRHAFIAPMKFRAGGMRFAARSSDVSRGGMFLETGVPPEPGATICVLFCAEGYPLELDATVCYRSPGVGVGVRFRSIPEDERAYLEGLLRRLQELARG